MRRAFSRFVLAVSITLFAPALAMADDAPQPDARWLGYKDQVTVQSSGSATLWLLFIALGALCLGVMFINARRSHLD